jgi:outer membrane protein TolC
VAQEALTKEVSETKRLAEIRFKNGVDDYFPVFDAQRQLYDAQKKMVTIELARLSRRAGLTRRWAAGGRSKR